MSDFFSTADMTELEDVAESAMAGTLVIKRQTNASDGMGAFTTTFPAVGTVACHVWPYRVGMEEVTGAQVQAFSRWYVAVPNGTDIREIDRCDYTNGNYTGTVTYLITDVPLGVTWKPHIECMAETYNREARA